MERGEGRDSSRRISTGLKITPAEIYGRSH
jgi:hypothetical protein